MQPQHFSRKLSRSRTASFRFSPALQDATSQARGPLKAMHWPLSHGLQLSSFKSKQITHGLLTPWLPQKGRAPARALQRCERRLKSEALEGKPN